MFLLRRPTPDQLQKNSIHYSKLDGVSITVKNPATKKSSTLQGLFPHESRCTLEVIMSPDGDGTLHIQKTLKQAKEFLSIPPIHHSP
jgi:hypothetical protein